MITDNSQLRAIFEGVGWARRKQNTGCVIREVLYANWFGAQNIFSVHSQLSFSKGCKGDFTQMKCLSKLVASNGQWKIKSTTYVEEKTGGEYNALIRLSDKEHNGQHYSPENKDEKLFHILD